VKKLKEGRVRLSFPPPTRAFGGRDDVWFPAGACPVLDTGDDAWIPAGVYPAHDAGQE